MKLKCWSTCVRFQAPAGCPGGNSGSVVGVSLGLGADLRAGDVWESRESSRWESWACSIAKECMGRGERPAPTPLPVATHLLGL